MTNLPILTIAALLTGCATHFTAASANPGAGLDTTVRAPSYLVAKSINAKVNSSTAYRTDQELYGHPDFWATADGAGDCEDFALAKRKRFIEQGFGDYVRLATAWVPREGYHAVLIVTTASGDYVLDNTHPLPLRRQELNWQWDKIQEGRAWRVIL